MDPTLVLVVGGKSNAMFFIPVYTSLFTQSMVPLTKQPARNEQHWYWIRHSNLLSEP